VGVNLKLVTTCLTVENICNSVNHLRPSLGAGVELCLIVPDGHAGSETIFVAEAEKRIEQTALLRIVAREEFGLYGS
jgi:hypothetical protein